jgi:hypothetical protein
VTNASPCEVKCTRGHQQQLSLVSKYNTRDLSYPEDVVSAFAGITTLLSHTFPGGFHFGLPLMFFDAALLWQPQTVVERRLPKDLSSFMNPIPSWSWVGWKGYLRINCWDQVGDYFMSEPPFQIPRTSVRTVPTVKWYSHQTRSSQGTQIVSTWYEYRKKYLDHVAQPPSGWALHKYHGHNGQYPQNLVRLPERNRLPSVFYTNDSYPEFRFWYPIPMGESVSSAVEYSAAKFISCRTQTAWLYKGERIEKLYISISVRDSRGNWAGMLQLQEEDECMNKFAQSHEHALHEDQKIQLVAISEGYFYNGSIIGDEYADEFWLEERPKSTEKYEFYNTLWIEWEDGIGIRKALGRISKEAWERQELEWIDLMLG